MRKTVALLTTVVALVWTAQAQLRPDEAERIRKAAPDHARVAPKRPRTVLIFSTPPAFMEKDPHKGYTIPQGEFAMKTLGEKTGAFKPVVSDDIAMFLPETLKQFDAIVLNNASGPWIRPTESDFAKFKNRAQSIDEAEQLLRRSLLDFVGNGGGLVGYHYAIGANGHWPEFRELFGARFTVHPWNEELAMRVEEPGHALAAAFPQAKFRLADEIYEFGPPYSRDNVRVLVSLDPDQTDISTGKWRQRTDDDYAQAWVRTQGSGRVFYCGWGHRTEIWWHAVVLQFYLDAIQFAAGDLEAAIAPRPLSVRPKSVPPPGFVALFDGNSLAGWDGDTRIWRVQDGTITGQTSPEVRVAENNFLIWKDPVENFELRLKYRLEGGNSGIYYRSRKRPAGEKGEAVVGTQADFSADGRWTGVIMEYTLREVLAERGEKVLIDESGKKQVIGAAGDPKKLLQVVKTNDWNDYTVIAKGGQVTLRINGKVMCELDDRDSRRMPSGVLALQVHTGPPMAVQFKDIFFRRL